MCGNQAVLLTPPKPPKPPKLGKLGGRSEALGISLPSAFCSPSFSDELPGSSSSPFLYARTAARHHQSAVRT